MPVEAIVGANWGDEGKGKITDLLAEHADIVVRFQGGRNAGHTVINEHGKFALHLVPSGVFHPHVVNVLGPGTAVDVPFLLKELRELTERGVPKPALAVSGRAQVVLPWHAMLDACEEERLGDTKFGSTRSGIAPFYASKYMKTGVQVADLYDRGRRVGWFDAVATRYGCQLQGATEMALSCLDVLGYLDEIPVCTAYEVDGERTERFPPTRFLEKANPVHEILPGWRSDISGARRFTDLPSRAQDYARRVESLVGVPAGWISVGSHRDASLRRS